MVVVLVRRPTSMVVVLVVAHACWPPRAGGAEATAHDALKTPSWNVPLWTPNVGARTDVCGRQMLVHQGNLSLRNALNELSLSMVFDDYAPYTMVDDSGAVTGCDHQACIAA